MALHRIRARFFVGAASRAIVRTMVNLARVLLLVVATLLSVGSSKQKGATRQSRTLQHKEDAQLRHPALLVVNRSSEVVRLALRGPVQRLLIAPPQEHTRTLLAAGRYKLVVQRGEQILRREKVLLQKGHRYRMEIGP